MKIRMVEIKTFDKQIPNRLINVDRINSIFPMNGFTRISYGTTGGHADTETPYEKVLQILEASADWDGNIVRLYEITE